MNIFSQWFGHAPARQSPELLSAIERAVNAVEPLLKQTGGYPDEYSAPVQTALEYAHNLAMSLPGPVTISREAYASDPLVHALFPSVESVTEALGSSLPLHNLLREYLQNHLRDFPADGELYGLMGMRRVEEKVMGMRMSGQIVQHDVVQNMVYFTSHTLDSLATSEAGARELVATCFFDRLVGKVAQRIAQRKQEIRGLHEERDMLMTQLHLADKRNRPELEEKLARMMTELQDSVGSLELGRYPDDFVAVMMNPEQNLRLEQVAIQLDSMGIRHDNDASPQGQSIVFNDLIGYDRRSWTVTMVRCSGLQYEDFTSRLERAYRTLAV